MGVGPNVWSRLPRTYSPRITLGFAGDTGEQGTDQTQLANSLNAANLDYMIFGGDNSYGGEAEFADDWAAFHSLFLSQKSLPVLGNHDIDGASTWNLHYNKFTYLPGNRRYWNKVLGNGLVEIFVLHSGYNSAGAVLEPDGNAVGSVQHQWFVATLAASTAKWKLVFFHHPPVTTEESAVSGLSPAVAPAMNWPEFAFVDGIFCGHTHMTEWISYRGIPLINASASVRRGANQGRSNLKLYGSASQVSQSSLLWVNDVQPLYARLLITAQRIVVEFRNSYSNQTVYTRDLSDQNSHYGHWTQEVLNPNDTTFTGIHTVGVVPVSMRVLEFRITVSKPGADPINGRILYDGDVVGYWSISPNQYQAVITSTDPYMVKGKFLQIEVIDNPGYVPGQGLSLTCAGNIFQ